MKVEEFHFLSYLLLAIYYYYYKYICFKPEKYFHANNNKTVFGLLNDSIALIVRKKKGKLIYIELVSRLCQAFSYTDETLQTYLHENKYKKYISLSIFFVNHTDHFLGHLGYYTLLI